MIETINGVQYSVQVYDCNRCEGQGRVWYPGCGDSDTACNICYGVGQFATYIALGGPYKGQLVSERYALEGAKQ